MRKIIKLLCAICCLLILNANCVFAGQPITNGGQKGPTGGTEYVRRAITYNNKEGYSHDTNNPTSEVQSHRFKVSRTKSSNFNTTISAEVNELIAKAGISLEIGIGSSNTIEVEHTWNIPKYSSYTLVYGSRLVKEDGYYNTWFNGRKVNEKHIYGHWSYRSYDDMIRR